MENSGFDEEDLFCTICTEIYDDPKLLPCAHRFCAGCLTKYVNFRNSSGGGTCPCPLCKKEFRTDRNLPSDHILRIACRKRQSLPYTKCKIHGILKSRYCKTCLQIVCAECVLSRHTHCQIVTTDHATSTITSKLKKEMVLIRNLKRDVDVAEIRLKSKSAEVTAIKAALRSEMNEIKRKWVREIDRINKEMDELVTGRLATGEVDLMEWQRTITKGRTELQILTMAIAESLESKSCDLIVNAWSELNDKRIELRRLQTLLDEKTIFEIPHVEVKTKPPTYIYDVTFKSEEFAVLSRNRSIRFLFRIAKTIFGICIVCLCIVLLLLTVSASYRRYTSCWHHDYTSRWHFEYRPHWQCAFMNTF